ncbi:MAG: glycosyltransferase [Gemmatimonadota bacterium]|nr:glycosyltransferase [Gemmatimonadota bacterium]
MSPSPLKVSHILLSRGFAGSERSTVESCNQQCLEHDVSLFVRRDHRKHGVSVLDHVDPGVKVVELGPRPVLKRQLRRAIETGRPDVIHCHLRRSTRLVAQIGPPAATVSTLHISVNGPHFVRMDGLVCNARWQLDEIPADYGGLVHKANNSLEPHRRLTGEEVAELRGRYVPEGGYLIGAVGRLHRSKGWDTLIEAFRRIQVPSGVRLVFFGAGRIGAKLEALADGHPQIVFAGYSTRVKDWYQAFDLLVCPSRFEPLPRVILEAMDGGAPVLASTAGGCKELIEDYGGTLFETDDVDALAARLEESITTRPPRHRPDLTAHYVENANAALVDFYRRVVDRKVSPPRSGR